MMDDIYTIFLYLRRYDLFKVKIDNIVYTHDDLSKLLNKDKNKLYFTFLDFYEFCKDKEIELVEW